MKIEPTDFYESERRFELWRYSVSHSQLLLRSNPDDAHSSRIEILFKSVDRIDIPTVMQGLRLVRNERTYLATGDGWSGAIDAPVMFVAEEARAYHEPSSFDGVPGSF